MRQFVDQRERPGRTVILIVDVGKSAGLGDEVIVPAGLADRL
jgi:hypothetical protein